MTATEILAIALLATWVLWGITLNANLTLRETVKGLRAADHSDCEAREAELIDELDNATADLADEREARLKQRYREPVWVDHNVTSIVAHRPRLAAIHDRAVLAEREAEFGEES